MLEAQVVLVTGASRGLGQAIADRLGMAGWTILGTATTQAGADAISARFESMGIKGKGYALDVCDSDQTAQVLKAMQDEFGSIYGLVNNAGITRDNLFLRMKEDQWDAVYETNLKAVFRLTKALVKPMLKKKMGRIINITSVVAATGNPGQANYTAMKAGVIGFSKSVAKEVASRGITVNCIAPGFIATDMTNALTDEQKETIASSVPMNRIGEPVDIAESVLFLLGPGGAYITGETLNVNGGMFMP